MDDLLVKQLTGEATAAENDQVQQWLKSDDSHRQYYDHFKLIWEESAALASTTTIDEQAAWDRFQQRAQYETTLAKRKTGMLLSISNPIMRAAAILLLVAGAAWLSYFLFTDGPVQQLAIESAENTRKDTLPDGSQVTLNKRSSLTFPDKFRGNERAVQLNGEAFFAITPNKKKPFIIHTKNNITIRVVGTSFNVKTRGDSTEVIVETGIVQVMKDQQEVIVQAGERTVIHHKVTVLQKQENKDHLYNYYRSKQFICEGTPLWKLVETLNEAYNVQIIIDGEELRNRPITTTFNNEPLDNVLNIIAITLSISAVKENGQIILR
jgi:ferric-dicitrate binding protein FerR (iron transport regulator)